MDFKCVKGLQQTSAQCSTERCFGSTMSVFQRPHQDTASTLIKFSLGDLNMVLAKEVQTQPVYQPLFPQILEVPPVPVVP